MARMASFPELGLGAMRALSFLIAMAGLFASISQGSAQEVQVCPQAPGLDSESVAAPVSRTAWIERTSRARLRYESFLCQALERRAVADIDSGARALTVRRSPRHGLDELYSDVTLRRGDIVVTEHGFRMFTGGALRPAAFQPIGAVSLPPVLWHVLQDLERASGLAPASTPAQP